MGRYVPAGHGIGRTLASGQYWPPLSHWPLHRTSVSRLVLPKYPAAQGYGQPVKFIGGKFSGDGEIHQPSWQWMVVSSPRLTMMSDRHVDSDEAKDTFRSVSSPELKTSQASCPPTHVFVSHTTQWGSSGVGFAPTLKPKARAYESDNTQWAFNRAG